MWRSSDGAIGAQADLRGAHLEGARLAHQLGGQLGQRLARRGRAILALGIAPVLPLADPATQGRPRQLTLPQRLAQPSDRLRTENAEPYPPYSRSAQNTAPVLSVSGR